MVFTPINIKTGYSFFYSTLKLEELFDDAIKNRRKAISVVDINSLFSALQINKFANANKLKTIIGMEVSLAVDGLISPTILIAKNINGYKNLTALTKFVSHANKEVAIDLETLEKYKQDVLIVIPIIKGLSKNFGEDLDSIKGFFNSLIKFKEQILLGLECYQEGDLVLLEKIRNIKDYSSLIVNEIRYLDQEDVNLLNVLIAIKDTQLADFKSHHNNALTDLSYLKFFNDKELSSHQSIIESIDVNVSDLKSGLIDYPLPVSDVKPEEYLRALANKGLAKRFNNDVTSDYQNRLNFELDLIIKMGFVNYFLVVWDYVKFAKNNDILVGPGRGSAAGSLVAYTLGITNVDPLKHGLMFERFLNPMRVSMPDVDIDFIDTKRDLVVKYLFDKYGSNHVARVITFQTFGVRQSLRDVAKAMGESLDNVNAIAKKVPSFNNQTRTMGLKELVENFPSFADYMFTRESYRKIYNLALKIEGLPRQTSYHAAGVVIAKDELSSFTPVYNYSEHDNATQFDMNYLEDIGLLKMDILGLSNLSIIEETIKLINNDLKQPFKLSDINIEDSNIYKLISNKLTLGLFQLESQGMQKAIEKIKPTGFEDIVAILALFRPGPMDFIPDYGRRKAGLEAVEYIDESLKDILIPTYGIIVYQEQIIKILQVYAGFDLAEADLVRKAISKKEESKLLEIKTQFLEKAKAKGRNTVQANQVFDLILKFANYGFNKAHSVSYAYITVQMSYLKYYYRHAFYTAILNNSNLAGGSGDETFGEYIDEASGFGIQLLPPSINLSAGIFTIAGNNQIRYSLGKIKGVGINGVNNILNERKSALYRSFADFVRRTYSLGINKKMLEALIDSGAFDEFKINRQTLRNNLGLVIEYAQLNQGLISDDPNVLPQLDLVEAEDDLELNQARELEICGIAFTVINTKFNREDLRKQGVLTIKEALLTNNNIKVLASIKSIRTFKTKSQQPMAVLATVDENSKLEMIIFPREYKMLSNNLKVNTYFIFEGNLQTKEKTQFIVSDLKEVA
jgi:DNA polymerase-3 subunit alpha